MCKFTTLFKVTNLELFPLRELRLLVVDSNPYERELLTFVFKEEKAEVIAVGSVEEALKVLEYFTPNVAISEINLPRKSGYSLLLQIRDNKSEQIARIPAIALTAAVTDKAQQLAYLAGFTKYITKPADLNELLKTVVSISGRGET